MAIVTIVTTISVSLALLLLTVVLNVGRLVVILTGRLLWDPFSSYCPSFNFWRPSPRSFPSGIFSGTQRYTKTSSCNIRTDRCVQDRCLVSSTKSTATWGDFLRSSKELTNIVMNSPSAIWASIEASCTELISHFATYLCMGWPVYFNRARFECRVAFGLSAYSKNCKFISFGSQSFIAGGTEAGQGCSLEINIGCLHHEKYSRIQISSAKFSTYDTYV